MIPGDFPEMAVVIGKIADVAAPEGVLGRFNDRGAGVLGLWDDGVDFLACGDVVGELSRLTTFELAAVAQSSFGPRQRSILACQSRRWCSRHLLTDFAPAKPRGPETAGSGSSIHQWGRPGRGA